MHSDLTLSFHPSSTIALQSVARAEDIVMKRLIALLLASLMALSFWSCGDRETEKTLELTQIVEGRDAKNLLEDLYIASDGDIESLARMLKSTPSTINRVRKGETLATPAFEERIKELTMYLVDNSQSFASLRAAVDPEYSWYDSVLDWPERHWSFWAISIGIIVITFFSFISFLAPVCFACSIAILIELLVFGVAWLCSAIFSPEPVVDAFTTAINPILEQLI